jgi:hypothetical protein
LNTALPQAGVWAYYRSGIPTASSVDERRHFLDGIANWGLHAIAYPKRIELRINSVLRLRGEFETQLGTNLLEGNRCAMARFRFSSVAVLLGFSAIGMLAQETKYPPISEYMMPQDAEISLAKSAAPAGISDHATIKVFTSSGYRVVHEGDNGFVCVVMRGFTGAPTFTPLPVRTAIAYDSKTRAPICFDPQAARTVLPYYEFRNRLGLEGKTPEEIAEAVQAAYVNGGIPQRHEVSFAYMWSADQILGPFGHWHPHVMVFAPNYVNSMLGGSEDFHHLPAVGDDAGTPFAVITIPVDESLAVKSRQ